MTQPVRVGTSLGVVYYVIWGVLSAVFAFLTKAIVDAAVRSTDFMALAVVNIGVWIALFIIGAAFTAAITWRYLPGRGVIDLDAQTLAVGRRTVPFAELTRVYRIAGGENPAEFGVRFQISSGRDLRLQVSSRSFTDVTIAQLDATLAMVKRAPIELDPRVTARPPVAGELGERSTREKVADTTAELIMLFEETSYRAAVLVAELERARDVLSDSDGTFPWAIGPTGNAKVAEILTTMQSQTTTESAVLPSATSIAIAGAVTVDYKRGFFGTLSTRYRSERTAVESWVKSVNPSVVIPTFARFTAAGWTLVGLMFFWPVISIVGFNAALYGGLYLPSPSPSWWIWPLGFFGFVFFLSPLFYYAGFVLTWYARVRRHRALRAAVLAQRDRGVVPKEVRDFFGSPHPDGYIEQPFIYLWGFAWCIALAGGITAIILGFAGWEVFGPVVSVLTIAVGSAFAIGSFPWFGVGVRRIGRRKVSSAIGELQKQLMGD
jgi:hypothetical protein